MQNSFQQSQLRSLEVLASSNISTTPNPAMAMMPPRKSNVVGTTFKSAISPVSDAVTKSTDVLKIIADNQAEQTEEFVTAINSTTKSIATIPVNIAKSLSPTMSTMSTQIAGLRENFQAMTIKQELQVSSALFTMDKSRLKQAQFAKGLGSDARLVSRLSSALLVAPSAVLVFTKPLNRIIQSNMTPEEKQISILGSIYNVMRFSGQELVAIRKKDDVNKFDTTRLRRDTILEKIADKLNTTPIIAPILEIGRILNKTADAIISPIESIKGLWKRIFPSKLSVGADLAAKAGLQFNAEKSAFQFLSNDFPNLAFDTVSILNKQLGVQENIQSTLEDLLSATTGQSLRRINQRDIIERKVFDPFTAQYVTVDQEKKLQEDRVKQAFNVRRRERGVFGRLFGLGKQQDLEAAKGSTYSNNVASNSNTSFGSASETLQNKDTSFVTGLGKAATVALALSLGPLGLISGLIGTSAARLKGKQSLLIDETNGVDFSSGSPQTFSTQLSDNSSMQSTVDIKQPKWQQVIEIELPKQSKLLGSSNHIITRPSKALSSTLPFNPITASNPNNIQSIDNRLHAKRDPKLKIEEEQLKALTSMGDILKKGIPINVSSMDKDKRSKNGNFLTSLLGSGIGGLVSLIGSGITSLGSVLMGTLFGGGALLLLKGTIKFLWNSLKTFISGSFDFIRKGITSLVKGAFTSILSFIKKIPFLGKAVSGIESLIDSLSNSSVSKKVAAIAGRFAAKEATIGVAGLASGPGEIAVQAGLFAWTAKDIYDTFFSDDSVKTDTPTKSEKPVETNSSSMFKTISSGASAAFDYVKTGASTALNYGKTGLYKLDKVISDRTNSNLPRGVRNNNPGNLRDNIPWLGMVGSDNGFAVFDTAEHGIRASAKNIKAYYTKHNINTVRGVISRWAPSSENNTSAYINDVSSKLGVAADDTLNMAKSTPALLSAIFHHENGGNYFPADMITNISNAALSIKPTTVHAFETAKNYASQSYDNVSNAINSQPASAPIKPTTVHAFETAKNYASQSYDNVSNAINSQPASAPIKSTTVHAFETAKNYASQSYDNVSNAINSQPASAPIKSTAVHAFETAKNYASQAYDNVSNAINSQPASAPIKSTAVHAFETAKNYASQSYDNVSNAINSQPASAPIKPMSKGSSTIDTPGVLFSSSSNNKLSGIYSEVVSSPIMKQIKTDVPDIISSAKTSMSLEIESLRQDLNSYMETNVAISKQLSANIQTLASNPGSSSPVVIPTPIDNSSNQRHSMHSFIDRMFSNIPDALSYQSIKFAGLSQEVTAHA